MKLRQISFSIMVMFGIGAAQYACAGDSIDLSGQWQFAIDRNDEGVNGKWYDKDLEGAIKLPGSMAEQGLGDDVSVETKWQSNLVDTSWYTHKRYEKYRQPGNIKLPWMLTPDKFYKGTAWYQRTVDVPQKWSNKRVVLNLERTHWTAQVWVNDIKAGAGDSLNTPNVFDITEMVKPGSKNKISIRMNNNNVNNGVFLGISSHTITDNSQSSWHGIVGDISLNATDKVWLDNVQVYSDVTNKLAKIKLTIGNISKDKAVGDIQIKAKCGWTKVPAKSVSFDKAGVVEIDYPMGDHVKLWDEFDPSLYTLTVELSGKGFKQSRQIKFGMRQLSQIGKQIAVNGNAVHLRGTVDNAGFPLTGYPPTDIESWRRIIGICKDYGMNHIRFHSWCPPEAAFAAADERGIYLQVEAGGNQLWLGNAEGATEKWLMAETRRILRSYGNHPSLIMLAHGNEAQGGEGVGSTHPTPLWLNDYVGYFKKYDSRVLYSSSAGYPLAAENEFHNIYRPRIQFWDHNLNSRINALPPETVTGYSDWVDKYPVPLVSHETGQWCAYPNLKEIPKYTGYAKAGNFEIVKESLDEKHMLDQADHFFMASGKLQVLCYKEEIESALRTPDFGGFQILSLSDDQGYGACLWGVLDGFYDEKGYVTASEFRRFCNDVVPLAKMQKRYWMNNETFTADIEVSQFAANDLKDQTVVWSLRAGGKTIAKGQFKSDLEKGKLCSVGAIKADLSGITKASKANLEITLEGTEYANDWDIWVYPAKLPNVSSDIVIVNELNSQTTEYLEEGKKVLLLADPDSVKGDEFGKVAIGFSSIFCNTSWTLMQAPHTLGILCDPADPMFANFPTEYHSNWQWWDLISKSGAMILDNLPANFRPKVQPIDTWHINRRLGIVFEAKVGKGELVVCSMDLGNDLDKRPVARQFRYSLLKYMNSTDFAPSDSLDIHQIADLFEPVNLARHAVVSSPDGLKYDSHASYVCAAELAIDGDYATYWDKEDGKQSYRLRLDFKEPVDVTTVVISGWKHHDFAAKDFDILCDDVVVKKIENAVYDQNRLTVDFPPVKCKSLELKITGCYGGSPAIRELEVYNKK